MTNTDQRPSADEPSGSGSTAAAPAAGAAVEVAEPKSPPKIITVAKRIPFTTAYVVITLVLAVVLGTLWSGIEQKSWYNDVAYGLPAFQDGRWFTLGFGVFFALYPVYYLFVAGAFALLTGFGEWRLGTARTVVICVVYQIAAVLVVAAIFWIFRDTNWAWVQQRSTETDVGFSAGMMAVFSVATATVKPPWRLRLRLLVWVYVLFSIMFIGQMADAEHLVAVALSMPFSTRLAGPHGLKARALPTRHEVRLLAFIAVLFVAASQVIAVFLPDRLTPFGPAAGSDDAWYLLVINLVITLLIANGLRHGYRWAWWVEIVLLAIPLLLSLLVAVVFTVAQFVDSAEATLDDVPQFTASALLSLGILRAADRRPTILPSATAQQTQARHRHRAPGDGQGTAPQVGWRHDLLDDDLAGQPAHDHRGRPELRRVRPARRSRCGARRSGWST